MPRNSESQSRAAHNRHHVKKGVVKSGCALCRAEHPNLTEEDLTPLVDAPRLPEKVDDQPNRPTQPVTILLPIPPKQSLPFDESMFRDRLYRFAALRRSVSEVSTALGLEEDRFNETVMAHFDTTWERLSERAAIEMELEVLSNVYMRAQTNDARFVLLYAKLRNLPEFSEQLNNPRFLPPTSVKSHLSEMSTDELRKLAEKYAYVVYRPSRFDTTGPLSPTVSIRPTTDEEKQQACKPYTPPVMPGSDADFARSQKTVTFAKPDLRTEPEQPKAVPEPVPQAAIEPPLPGPITYHPEPGMLTL